MPAPEREIVYIFAPLLQNKTSTLHHFYLICYLHRYTNYQLHIKLNRSDKNLLDSREEMYLMKWLRREGMNKIYKLRHMPEMILDNYKLHLVEQGREFKGTTQQRLNAITSYIDFILNIFPRYKKFLKVNNIRSYEIGLQLGYKNATNWHNSYKKFTYIRLVVNIAAMQERTLKAHQ